MKDSLVPQEVMDAVRLYYTKLGVNPANIKYVNVSYSFIFINLSFSTCIISYYCNIFVTT